MAVDLAALSVILVICAGSLGWWLTGKIRQYALASNLLDVPNARSSHEIPTPRGGGVAIVATFILALPVITYTTALDPSTAVALSGAGIFVAIIGAIDDHRHVAARWRLAVHFVASAWLLYWIPGGVEALPVILGGERWLDTLLYAAALVWLLNLFNFMDGIDGIAGVEAISVCIGGAIIGYMNQQPVVVMASLSLAAAVAGFLVWNIPPARIFLGDAGSGFLGMSLGGLAMASSTEAEHLLWAWTILLAVFVSDASVTLVRRAINGERVYEAHHSHAYQRLARRFGSHLPVTVAVGIINFFFLIPLATLVAADWIPPWWGLSIAYVPLIVAVIACGAGKADD